MKEMNHIFRLSKLNARPKNLLIIAEPGSGKTALSKAFVRSAHGDNLDQETIIACAQMPAVPTEKGVMLAILESLGVDFVSNHTMNSLLQVFRNIVTETDVRMIIFDEFNNLLAAGKSRILGSLNLLKWIGNEFQIPIIALGTSVSNLLLTYDAQFKERYRQSSLEVWSDGEDFRNFIFTYLDELPGTEFRELTDPLFKTLLIKTSRTTNDIVSVLSHSAYEHYTERKQHSFYDVVKDVSHRNGYLT